MISPERQPKTCSERENTTESGHTLFFNNDDLRDVYQQAFPIAIVHHSKDHFVPTATISPNAYNSWKVTALHGMLKNCQTVIEEVDTNLLTSQQKMW